MSACLVPKDFQHASRRLLVKAETQAKISSFRSARQRSAVHDDHQQSLPNPSPRPTEGLRNISGYAGFEYLTHHISSITPMKPLSMLL
ncbi:hypothetical protein RIB2604_02109770 [Aspergillus luchuensis]|uniref:Uncharacterized protein n=1 Tax=Aspergillus kawachii TaxID=1069201 RepID=A0A146FPM8_ASPKA|nr:hypothetical protein RIB2604_02109770 [Aspergillus luchuensis]